MDTITDQLVRRLSQLERRVDDLIEPEVAFGAVGGSGAITQVAYWTGVSTIAGDAGFTYAAGTDTITLNGGITLTGGVASTIVVNDNAADVLGIEDAGGLEYLRIISTNAQPITRFNDGGVDIDFYVEAVGVADALFIRGSDGQFTVGALGAGFVRSDAGGVLSSSALIAGDLPAHTHSGAGQGGSLVIGTTDTDATAGSVLFAGVAGVIQEDNANFFWDDTNNHLGIGATPLATTHLYVFDNALNITTSYYGIYAAHTKIAGITDAADLMFGSFNQFTMSQAGGIVGVIQGGYHAATLTDGTTDYLIGEEGIAAVDGGLVNQDAYAVYGLVGLTGGTINVDVIGGYFRVDIEAAATVGGTVYGVYVWVDDDDNTSTSYMVYLDGQSNVDYGFYQASLEDNFLGGYLGIGDNSPDAPLDVTHATTDIVAFFESGDDIAGIKCEDDDTAGYFYVADGDIHIGGDAAKAVTNLHVDVSTGYLSSGSAPGNIHLDLYDATLTSTATFYGMRSYHIKTAGAGGAGDDYRAISGYMDLNQATTIDNLWGGRFEGAIQAGTADRIHGVQGYANTDGGTVNLYVAGGIHLVIAETGGTIEDVYGTRTEVTINAGPTINNDVFGHYILVTDNVGAGGTVYGLYVSSGTGLNYGIYQNGSAYNYLGGHTSVGNDADYDTRHFQAYDDTITTTLDYYGGYFYHEKAAGVTDINDDFVGIYNVAAFTQNAGVLGDVVGTYSGALADDGSCQNLYGTLTYAITTGGTVNTQVFGSNVVVDLDTGTVAAVAGAYVGIDIENTMTSVTGDVSGVYISIDDDEGAGGTVYGIFFEELSGVDYFLHSDGTAISFHAGHVLIGTENSDYQIYVEDNVVDYVGYFFNDGDNSNRQGIGVQCGEDDADLCYNYDCLDGDADLHGGVRINTATVEVWQVSDESLKENIKPTQYGLQDILSLPVRDFNWKKHPNAGNVCGFVAQEVDNVIPGLVAKRGELLTTAPSRLIPVLVRAIQEQQAEIDALKQRLH